MSNGPADPRRLIARVRGATANVRGRLRSLRFRTILLGALLLSTVLVAAHIPLRWQGGRTAQDADIPLRPLTPLETAALLSGASNGERLVGLVQLTDDDVVVRTRVYPLITGVSGGECPGRASYRGTTYQICSSSWEGYHNVHFVSRSALERELGRRLTDQDVTPDYLSDSAASFSSNRLLGYFATEVVFLTGLLTALVSSLRLVRSPLLVPPLITAAGICASLFVPYYSPAFIDADWFYQRIALEEVIGGRGPLGLSFLAIMGVSMPLTVVCVPLYALNLFVQGVRRLSGQTSRRLWIAVTSVLLAALSIQLGVEYGRYRVESRRAGEALGRLELALDAGALTALKSDFATAKRDVDLFRAATLSPAAAAAAESILSAVAPVEQGRVFIRMADGWNIFLEANRHFNYADVRRLKEDESARVIDYDLVEALLRAGQPYDTSFWRYLGSAYLAGRAFRDRDHHITAVGLVGPETPRLDARWFRWWWRLLFSRPMFEPRRG